MTCIYDCPKCCQWCLRITENGRSPIRVNMKYILKRNKDIGSAIQIRELDAITCWASIIGVDKKRMKTHHLNFTSHSKKFLAYTLTHQHKIPLYKTNIFIPSTFLSVFLSFLKYGNRDFREIVFVWYYMKLSARTVLIKLFSSLQVPLWY